MIPYPSMWIYNHIYFPMAMMTFMTFILVWHTLAIKHLNHAWHIRPTNPSIRGKIFVKTIGTITLCKICSFIICFQSGVAECVDTSEPLFLHMIPPQSAVGRILPGTVFFNLFPKWSWLKFAHEYMYINDKSLSNFCKGCFSHLRPKLTDTETPILEQLTFMNKNLLKYKFTCLKYYTFWDIKCCE